MSEPDLESISALAAVSLKGFTLSLPRLLALAGMVAAFNGSAAGAHAYSPAPPAKGSGVQCGDTITTDTLLQADLVNCPGDGIVIGADHVTLDLGGHTIDGEGAGRGVSAAGRRDVEVKRGAVQGFADGVRFDHVTEGTVRALALGGNGIECLSSSACTIEGNTVFGAGIVLSKSAPDAPSVVRRNVVRAAAGAGISVNYTSRETTVESNVLEHNGAGVEAIHASVGRIGGNTIRANDSDGIRVSAGGDTQISGNMVWRNGRNGIALDHFADARIYRNYVARNRGHGIRGETLARPLLGDNVAIRNRGSGILLTGATPAQEPTSFAVLTGNVAGRNARDGIAIGHATRGSDLGANVASRNGDDGIDVATASATLTSNRTRRNGDRGIEAVAGVVDAGGNRALRNGHRAQCAHVRCR
jgi:Periplasmic copper-binding protein (NosD)